MPTLQASRPLALAEYRDASAVGMNTVDVDLLRTDHPVDMNQALLAALRGDLMRRQIGAVEEAFRIALAQRDVPADPPGMRRGEYFLGRDIRVAGDPVLGRGGAALPFVTVGEPDLQVGAGSGIMQRAESLSIQPFGPAAQCGVVLVPRRDGLIIIDARGSEDRFRKLCHRDI